MSKLSILSICCVAFALTSSTALAQRPGTPQRFPQLFAQTSNPGHMTSRLATGQRHAAGGYHAQQQGPHHSAGVMPGQPVAYAMQGEPIPMPANSMSPGNQHRFVPTSGNGGNWDTTNEMMWPDGSQSMEMGSCYGDGCGGMECDDPYCSYHQQGHQNCQTGCGEPVWYLRGEAVWLSRNDPPTRNISVYDVDGADPLEDFIVLGTNDLDLRSALGTRWTLGRYLNEKTSIEGGFYGFFDWDDRVRTPLDEANRPYDPYWGDDDETSFDNSNFEGAAQHVLSYSTDFDSAELGIRRWVRSDTSLLVGFRYMSLDEDLSLLSYDEGTPDLSDIGLYQVNTQNKLFGVQVGTEYVHQLGWRCLYFNLDAKAGAYLNSAQHDSSLYVTEPTVALDSRSEESVSFARSAELSLGLILQVTDCLSLRGGYTVNFINGVATAPDNLDMTPHRFNSGEFINDNGTVMLHGAYFGGEWIWGK